ncbi:MAG: ATP-binding cassette domain-containing protein [Clostridia bacterium]|nr:ATP-binding cassette domain-containing protein [Clostridia bacterium]
MIKLSNIVKKFYIGEPNELEILHGISLEVEEGEFISIVGPSGSGKSTLMNLIGVLDRPTSGSYILDGIDVANSNDSELSEIRNQKIGFVFQTYNLIPKTNAIKNIELPMLYGGMNRKERIERARYLLDLVEMSDRAKHLPEELSGGQKQRVAIARAMANNPAIILADEPTGALDSKTGRLVMDLFHKLNKQEKKTIILITHSSELASETDRIVSIRDGLITKIVDNREFKEANIAKNRKEQDEKSTADENDSKVETAESIVQEIKEIKENSIEELNKNIDEKLNIIEANLASNSDRIDEETKKQIEERVEKIKNNINELTSKINKFDNNEQTEEGGQE